MNFYLERFSILSKSLNKSFSEPLEKGMNIIIGGKDSGKTSFARAIMYTLGCEVRNFDLIEKYPDAIFMLEFLIGSEKYILVRQRLNKKGIGKNCFKLFHNEISEIFFNTTDFSKRLNDILGIKMITLNKNNEKTCLFPNHIFLPFYIDQDFSWQNYLTSTFTGIKFINNYKKLILEYFSGMRSNKYYELLLSKNEIKQNYQKISSLIESKELILEENFNNIKIIEDVDIVKFKEKYETVLKVYDNIIDTEHRLKKIYNKNLYEKNNLEKHYDNLNISIEEIIPQEIEDHCPNCKQVVYKEIEENYKLLLSKENLIKEREKVQLYLKKVEENMKQNENELKVAITKSKDLKTKLDADSQVVTLAERAESYAFSNINTLLSNEIKDLLVKKEEKKLALETVEKDLHDLNNNNVAPRYNQLMLKAYTKLEIPFSFNNYYTNNLESVKINLSGASKVQAFLAQYLSVYEMTLDQANGLHFPMIIDTYLKDDLNHEEINRTTDFVLEKLNIGHQSFLFISDNIDTLKRIEETDVSNHKITLNKESQLFTKTYEELYKKYQRYLEKEFID
ncbi:AAA family ATPase [Enterococcus casseliflavus]|uniref:AAA family ATPase n=1 Tax=Enterococcus casseliflavus TaxID=37734 RepID=UPI0008F1B6FE|nr:AAA family ATPase [Enterococcus casseliflavus]MBO6350230.1 hypothetical protein [Enterococcus casseliflavus]MBO6368363.1 hypothetical protein [Enterococcus casseliflavus]SFE30385.1 hypothetical protein SAMN04487887_109127 [Enterococcus casseliflavus]